MSKTKGKYFIRYTDDNDDEYQTFLLLKNYNVKLLSFKSVLLRQLIDFKLKNNIDSLIEYIGYIQYYGIRFDNKNTFLLNMNDKHMQEKFKNYQNLITKNNKINYTKFHNGNKLFKKIKSKNNKDKDTTFNMNALLI